MQPAGFETTTLGMHECIPYELSTVFPFHVLPQKALPFGMHKCIPYAKSDISVQNATEKRYRAGNGVTITANPPWKIGRGASPLNSYLPVKHFVKWCSHLFASAEAERNLRDQPSAEYIEQDVLLGGQGGNKNQQGEDQGKSFASGGDVFHLFQTLEAEPAQLTVEGGEEIVRGIQGINQAHSKIPQPAAFNLRAGIGGGQQQEKD